MSESGHCLCVRIAICSPSPLFKHVGQIAESASALVVRGGKGRKYFAMGEYRLEVLPAGRGIAVELLPDGMEVRAAVRFVALGQA